MKQLTFKQAKARGHRGSLVHEHRGVIIKPVRKPCGAASREMDLFVDGELVMTVPSICAAREVIDDGLGDE